jgi:rhodanese-related sulfurtransferase
MDVNASDELGVGLCGFDGMLLRLRRLAVAATTVLVAATALTAPAFATGQTALLPLERKLERQFPSVEHMIPEHFEQALARDPNSVLLLDSREQYEYEISHLHGALRVDPGILTRDFMTRFGKQVSGRKVVIYCSVGYRSSKLAQRLREALLRAGARGVYNLRGGLFAWHNTGRPTVKGSQATYEVHPYSRRWSHYLDFDNYVSFGEQSRSWLRW